MDVAGLLARAGNAARALKYRKLLCDECFGRRSKGPENPNAHDAAERVACWRCDELGVLWVAPGFARPERSDCVSATVLLGRLAAERRWAAPPA
jgi:hypothetical protein